MGQLDKDITINYPEDETIMVFH